ncbi:conserved hypothetcial protein [Sporisorium reilianum SRZ2]|uniref:Conserved hypothetcial protein n=2 Tax=Sporisorium reilianum TaxID=72558 RepID=E6ZWG2_SPORE|nr:conserved hypothetcial protein [Sporisorium reilianum SRZ2]SJX66604.1 related to NAD(P)H-dependent oxidoreductase [Sporisorium reilianum f. sp. reilianum]
MATSKTAAVLRGAKVVIIGGSSGMGFAAASALIEEGATVVIGSSSAERVSSAVARLSDPAVQYNADAARVSGHTRNLALDLSARNIRVNGVSPGPVETELWSAIPEEQRKGFLDQMGSKLLTGKVGAAEDVANVYVYLLKDRNATGQVVVTDGGSTVADRP